jgi:hypothetical protein
MGGRGKGGTRQSYVDLRRDQVRFKTFPKSVPLYLIKIYRFKLWSINSPHKVITERPGYCLEISWTSEAESVNKQTAHFLDGIRGWSVYSSTYKDFLCGGLYHGDLQNGIVSLEGIHEWRGLMAGLQRDCWDWRSLQWDFSEAVVKVEALPRELFLAW